MKYEFRYYHIFCLVNAGFVSGAEILTKYVCSGDSVQAFENIKFNNCSSVVSLYINGDRNTLIAKWAFEHCSRNEILLPDYNERVFLNGNGTVSIHNVHPWDQAKYIVNWQRGDEPMEDVVEIQVMAAPANDCIPNILHKGSSLFASLKAHSCGKPVATLYWKGYGDVPNTREPVLKIHKGNHDVTYHACIEGPALTCVRNALNYCSSVTVEGYKTPPMESETWDVKTAMFIVGGIVLGILVIVSIAVILVRLKRRKTILKESGERSRVNDNARRTFGDNEGRTEMREVKNRNSVPGLPRAIIGSEDRSDEFHDAHFMPLLQKDHHRPTHDDNLSGQHMDSLVKEIELLRKQTDDLLRLFKDSTEAQNERFNTLSGQHMDSLVKETEILRNRIDDLRRLFKDSTKAQNERFNELRRSFKDYTDDLRRQHKDSLESNHENGKEHFNTIREQDRVYAWKPKEPLTFMLRQHSDYEDVKDLLSDKKQHILKNDCDMESHIIKNSALNRYQFGINDKAPNNE